MKKHISTMEEIKGRFKKFQSRLDSLIIHTEHFLLHLGLADIANCIADGCSKLGPNGCTAYLFPKEKWKLHSCPLSNTATDNAIVALVQGTKKVNPLKASKRGEEQQL